MSVEHHPLALSCEQSFARILRNEGPSAAIRYINRLIPHRLTAMFRLEGSLFVPTHAFDKQGQLKTEDLPSVHFLGSYCEMVMLEGHFVTADSRTDPRAARSTCSTIFRSYVGMPLLTADGKTFGSICHADFIAQPAPDNLQFNFFKAAAQEIARALNTETPLQSASHRVAVSS